MEDLNTVQTASERKTVCDNAVANQAQPSFIESIRAAQQASLQKHFCHLIYEWCNETNINSSISTEGTLSIPVANSITGNVLDEWQTALKGRGYRVIRTSYDFTVKL